MLKTRLQLDPLSTSLVDIDSWPNLWGCQILADFWPKRGPTDRVVVFVCPSRSASEGQQQDDDVSKTKPRHGLLLQWFLSHTGESCPRSCRLRPKLTWLKGSKGSGSKPLLTATQLNVEKFTQERFFEPENLIAKSDTDDSRNFHRHRPTNRRC